MQALASRVIAEPLKPMNFSWYRRPFLGLGIRAADDSAVRADERRGPHEDPFQISLVDEADDLHPVGEVLTDTGIQDSINGPTTLAVPLAVDLISSVARPIHTVDAGLPWYT